MSQPCTHNDIGSIVASRENDDLYGACLDCGVRLTGSVHAAFHPRPTLAWTIEKPTTPGFYFYREDGEVYVCEITKEGKRLLCVVADVHPPDGIDPREMLENIDGEWAGPLEVPE